MSGDFRPNSTGEPRYGAVRLLLVALLFILAAPVFWHHAEISRGSVSRAYENATLYQWTYPVYHYGFGRLRADDTPMWNPHQLCGAPFQADPATGLYQPLNLVFLQFPTEQAMALHAYICLTLMGLFFVLFARSIGVGYSAALTGGVVYAFCGSTAAAMSRPCLATALVWMPFVFWALREYASRWRLSASVPAGIGLGMLVLSGSPALVVATLLLWIAYRLLLTTFPPGASIPPWTRRVTGLVVMGTVALGVSAVQWIPTAFWAVDLEAPFEALWRMDLAGQLASSPRETLRQIFSVQADLLPDLAYVGIPTLLVIPAAVLHRKGRREAFYFLICGVLSVLAASSAKWKLPLDFPREVFFYPYALCAATAAALGMDRLLTPATEHRGPSMWPAAVLVIAASGTVLYVGSPGTRGRVIVFCILLAPFLLWRTRWAVPVAGLAMASLFFVDLAVASINCYSHPFQDAPECYRTHAHTLADAREQALGDRVVVATSYLDTSLPANLGMLFPVDATGGAGIPLSKDQATWWRHALHPGEQSAAEPAVAGENIVPKTLASNLWNYMSARVILTTSEGIIDEEGSAGFRPINTGGSVRLFTNPNAVPRVYWAPAWRRAANTGEAIELLEDPQFDGSRCCVIQDDSPGIDELARLLPETDATTVSPASQSADATCKLELSRPERVVISVSAPQPGVTLLADTYAPGWRATRDGASCPILEANGIFRGVATPAGTHTIVFEYDPAPYKAGRIITLGTLFALVATGLVRLARTNRPNS